MFSTKNLPEKKNLPKTLQPGNVVAKLNKIFLKQGYESDSYNIILALESEDLGKDFEGFLIDKNDSTGPRYKGQVAEVRISPYSFNWTIKGQGVDRNMNMLEALKKLANGLGKGENLDEVKAGSMEQFVDLASSVLAGPTFYNWCLAGKEYTKNNFVKYDLFLPKPVYRNPNQGKDELPYEILGVSSEQSLLMKFDPARHITGKKPAASVGSFSPGNTGGYTPVATSDDDDLPF